MTFQFDPSNTTKIAKYILNTLTHLSISNIVDDLCYMIAFAPNKGHIIHVPRGVMYKEKMIKFLQMLIDNKRVVMVEDTSDTETPKCFALVCAVSYSLSKNQNAIAFMTDKEHQWYLNKVTPEAAMLKQDQTP